MQGWGPPAIRREPWSEAEIADKSFLSRFSARLRVAPCARVLKCPGVA